MKHTKLPWLIDSDNYENEIGPPQIRQDNDDEPINSGELIAEVHAENVEPNYRAQILIDHPEIRKKWEAYCVICDRLNYSRQVNPDSEKAEIIEACYRKLISELQQDFNSFRLYRFSKPGGTFEFFEKSYERANEKLGTLNCKLISITKI